MNVCNTAVSCYYNPTEAKQPNRENIMKNFYIFMGQNATCGTPHPVTGNLNMHGDLIAFSTKEKRDHFFDEYNPNRAGIELTKCTDKTCRKFFRGMTVYHMQENIRYIDQCVDEAYTGWIDP